MDLTLHVPYRHSSTLDALVSTGALSAPAAASLAAAVKDPSGACVLVAGNTNTGRTTIASCLATAAGMSRPVLSTGPTPDLLLHRRYRHPVTAASPEASSLPAALAFAEESSHALPVLVVDEDIEATRWALEDPAASRYTRILTWHAGSPSGALARLLSTTSLDAAALSQTVDLVVYCDRDSSRRCRTRLYAPTGVEGETFLLDEL